MSVGDLRASVAEAVRNYIADRLATLGKPAAALGAADLFDEGVLDSVSLTALIAAVESATGGEIDFIDVDPDALGTIDGIVAELTRALR